MNNAPVHPAERFHSMRLALPIFRASPEKNKYKTFVDAFVVNINILIIMLAIFCYKKLINESMI